MTYAIECSHCKELISLPGHIHDYDHKRTVRCPNCKGYLEVSVQIKFIVRKVSCRWCNDTGEMDTFTNDAPTKCICKM